MNENDEMMEPVSSIQPELTESMGFTNPIMDYDPAEDGEKKLYDSNEMSAICGLSLPRLSQLRTGQTITKGDRTYVFEPLFELGVDYIMDGSKAFYTEEALKKLKERKKPKAPKQEAPKAEKPKKEETEVSPKVGKRGRKTLKETPPELSQKGFILVNEVSEKMNIKKEKLYTIFYKYKSGHVLNEDGTIFQIEEGKDFVTERGRIAIHKDLVDRIIQSTPNKEPQAPTLSLIYRDRILKMSKEESEKILEILSETSKAKIAEIV